MPSPWKGVVGRVREIGALFLLLGAVLGARLLQLQVVEHDFWSHEALSARTRSRSLPFRRGSILDRREIPLATSESSYDLGFLFSDFRKGTTTGRLLLAHYLLTGERCPLPLVLWEPEPIVAELVQFTVADYRTLVPRQRRLDLCVYASWLLGRERSGPVIDWLNEAPGEALFCPELGDRARELLDAVQGEREFLLRLEQDLGLGQGELVAGMEDAVRWIDERVLRALAQREDARERPFEAERELHREFDYRVRTLARNVEHSVVYELLVTPQRFPGLLVPEGTRRVYPAAYELCPLLIGFVGVPGEEQLALAKQHDERLGELLLQPSLTRAEAAEAEALRTALREVDYRSEEEVGRYGLEAVYEEALRGRRGYLRLETDRHGEVRECLEDVPPVPGRDVVLTLDAQWQRAAEELLAARAAERGDPGAAEPRGGALVVLELPEQKVRVLASFPETTRTEFRESGLANPTGNFATHPRAYGPYFPPPPGSSLKPLIAAMALSEGLVRRDTLLLCNRDQLGPAQHPVRCLGSHGDVPVVPALVKSCNHYFARLALEVGYEKLFAWSEAFGFGRATDFAHARFPVAEFAVGRLFPPEVDGPLNHAERGERNLMVFGFGQGAIDDVTPLQVASAVASFAQREARPPALIERVGQQTPLRDVGRPLAISADAWNTVVEALRAVTSSPEGTAAPGRVPGLDLSPYDLATKTGTPQVAEGEDHSWFVGFFPSRAPRYAFAVFLEHTGLHGGDVCAPVWQRFLQSPGVEELELAARGGRAP